MLEKAQKLVASCVCGQKHSIKTSMLECRDGATELLISYIKELYPPEEALVVSDENTEKYAVPIVAALGCRSFVLPGNAHANETETARLSSHMGEHEKPAVIIACGSGSVHDIVRFCAHKERIPFVSYPTAASVDGFVSGVAAMTMYGQKLTYPSSSPEALFAEPAVFSSAPRRLTASGIGDMIGKVTALFDWRVSNMLTGEPLCHEIYGMMQEALDSIIDAASHNESDPGLPVLVMKGLLLSGLCMQLAGNSRPASGSEHHMSHFWEMHVANAPTDALHGEKVGVGTVYMLSHIKSNADIIDRDLVIDKKVIFSDGLIRPIYGDLTDGIIKENSPSGFGSSALAKLGNCALTSHAGELHSMIDALPSSGDIRDLLASCGCPASLSEIGLPETDGFLKASLRFSPYVRNRLTFAKIISAVSISEEAKNT